MVYSIVKILCSHLDSHIVHYLVHQWDDVINKSVVCQFNVTGDDDLFFLVRYIPVIFSCSFR